MKKVQSELRKITTSGLTLNQLKNADPKKLGNDQGMEKLWAEKAGKYADTYFNVLTIMKDKAAFKLTTIDDIIYEDFLKTFPDMRIDVIDEDQFKSKKCKKVWRKFCPKYENKVKDWNMGSLLR